MASAGAWKSTGCILCIIGIIPRSFFSIFHTFPFLWPIFRISTFFDQFAH